MVIALRNAHQYQNFSPKATANWCSLLSKLAEPNLLICTNEPLTVALTDTWLISSVDGADISLKKLFYLGPTVSRLVVMVEHRFKLSPS